MDIWEKVVKNNGVMDILAAKLKNRMRDDSRPLVHNAFSEEEPVQNVSPAVTAPKRKTEVEVAVEECEQILQNILDGYTDNLKSKLTQVVIKCDTMLYDPYDVSEMFTKVCKMLCDEKFDVPIACINAYLEMFTTKFNPLHCEELLNITEVYFVKNFADEYEKGEYGTPIGLYKILNNQLREKILNL